MTKGVSHVVREAYDADSASKPFTRRDLEVAMEAQFGVMAQEIQRDDVVPAFKLKFIGYYMPSPRRAIRYYYVHRELMKQNPSYAPKLRAKAAWLIKLVRLFGGFKKLGLWKKPMNIQRHLSRLSTGGYTPKRS